MSYPLRLWTGCSLYMPMELDFNHPTGITVRCPQHGDSFTLETAVGPWSLEQWAAEIEKGESHLAYLVMGWAVCERRNRWMRAAAEHDGAVAR